MRKGLTLIGIMIFIALISLIAAVSISKFLHERINTNESVAQEALKTITVALEKYAQDHNGLYADTEAKLLPRSIGGEAQVPYFNKSYCGKTENGYTFSCNLKSTGYTLTARPQNCTTAGTKSFTVTTGGVFSQDTNCTASGG